MILKTENIDLFQEYTVILQFSTPHGPDTNKPSNLRTVLTING
jgi:hypothetical protein